MLNWGFRGTRCWKRMMVSGILRRTCLCSEESKHFLLRRCMRFRKLLQKFLARFARFMKESREQKKKMVSSGVGERVLTFFYGGSLSNGAFDFCHRDFSKIRRWGANAMIVRRMRAIVPLCDSALPVPSRSLFAFALSVVVGVLIYSRRMRATRWKTTFSATTAGSCGLVLKSTFLSKLPGGTPPSLGSRSIFHYSWYLHKDQR